MQVMKCGWSPDALRDFNWVEAPAPYNLYGKKRYSNLDKVYEIIFARAVFNGTGDTKANNDEIAKILNISDRQVRSLIAKLIELKQVKVFSVTYYTGGGVKTSRIIRVLAAHAHLNYRYRARKEVFGKRKGEQFDYSLLDNIFLKDRTLRHRTIVEVDEIAVIPEWADDPEYTSNSDFLEMYRPVTEIYEVGKDAITKLKEGIVPWFLVTRYNEWRAGWDELDFHAILVLGTEKAVRKTVSRLRKANEHVSSIEA